MSPWIDFGAITEKLGLDVVRLEKHGNIFAGRHGFAKQALGKAEGENVINVDQGDGKITDVADGVFGQLSGAGGEDNPVEGRAAKFVSNPRGIFAGDKAFVVDGRKEGAVGAQFIDAELDFIPVRMIFDERRMNRNA